jgi:hypothetical protein
MVVLFRRDVLHSVGRTRLEMFGLANGIFRQSCKGISAATIRLLAQNRRGTPDQCGEISGFDGLVPLKFAVPDAENWLKWASRHFTPDRNRSGTDQFRYQRWRKNTQIVIWLKLSELLQPMMTDDGPYFLFRYNTPVEAPSLISCRQNQS